MKKFIYGFVLGLLALFGTAAVADYTIKDGGGSTQTVLAFVCATTKICPAHVLIKSDGTEIGTNSNPVYTNIVSSAVGATAGTTSTGALGQMTNCASTTSPSGQSTGNQSLVNCTTNGQVRVTPSYGTMDAVGDPCQTVAKINFTGTQTTGTQIIAGTSSKKTYICSFSIRAAAAEIWNVIAGTGSVCATGSSAVAGSTTAANGFSEAANGGQTLGNGLGTVMAATAANADNICITQNGSSRLTYQLTYVQQ